MAGEFRRAEPDVFTRRGWAAAGRALMDCW